MPGVIHEALVDMIRHRPEVLLRLLGEAAAGLTGVEAMSWSSESVGEAVAAERRADLVAVFKGKEPLATPVEIQLRIDRNKRFTWPQYVTGLWQRLRVQVRLVIITPFERVARWARQPIELGPGSVITPLVIGPRDIPVVTDPTEPPELLVLSAMAHGREDVGADIAWAAIRAAGPLDEDRRALYTDLVLNALPAAIQARLEELMHEGYTYQSNLFKRLIAQGAEEGREEGLSQGLSQGREQGLSQGREEGALMALRDAIVALLSDRDVEVTDAFRARLLATADHATLLGWLRRAPTVDTVDALV